MIYVLTDDLDWVTEFDLDGQGSIVTFVPKCKEDLLTCCYDAVAVYGKEQAQMVRDCVEFVGFRTAEVDLLFEADAEFIRDVGSVCDLRYSLQMDSKIITPADVAFLKANMGYYRHETVHETKSGDMFVSYLNGELKVQEFQKEVRCSALVDLFCEELEDYQINSINKFSQLSAEDSWQLDRASSRIVSTDVFISVKEFCEIYNRWEEMNGN